MKSMFQNSLFSVIIFVSGLASSSLASDRIEFPETQNGINKIVANTAKEFLLSRPQYEWKISSISDFKELSISSEHWKLIETPLEVRKNVYRDYPTLVYLSPLSDVPFSTGLRDLIDKPAVLDCTLAHTICRIVCMQALMGNHFDDYAKTVADDLAEKNSLNRFIFLFPSRLTERVEGLSAVPIGALFGYNNIPEYTTVHPKGMTQAENLYCVEEGKYLGFGSHFNEPKTLTEIADDFYEALMVESQNTDGKNIQLKYKNNKQGFIEEINKRNRVFNVGLFDLNKIKNAQSSIK